ncbi:MAG: diaminopimelate epimerase [Phycisphaerales bacterium]|nr:diaminopimelate epimerase [Phycisphaerales bacterium]
MHLVKMHGLGNDYLFLDAGRHPVEDPAAVSRLVSDRHRGLGSDGLILVLPPRDSSMDGRMRMFNADGSEGEMCGNGIRCLAKYLVDRGYSTANPLRVETAGGERLLSWSRGEDGKVGEVSVAMGQPILAQQEIPAQLVGCGAEDRVVEHPIDLAEFGFDETSCSRGGVEPRLTLVSMGNPHAIVYADAPEEVDLASVGMRFERHPAFPHRINLHLVRVDGDDAVSMRTWERGSGLTQACGTGACAACVAGALGGRHAGSIVATLPGGQLALEWPGDGAEVRMTGPAVEVYEIEIDPGTLGGSRQGS